MTVTGVRVTLVRLLGRSPDALATELMESMLRNGSIVARQGRLYAAAEHTLVVPGSLDVPFPRTWQIRADFDRP